jgi:hypothetical protein
MSKRPKRFWLQGVEPFARDIPAFLVEVLQSPKFQRRSDLMPTLMPEATGGQRIGAENTELPTFQG